MRFLGDVHDIPAFLQVLELFLIPSLWEGLPMALLKAMAAIPFSRAASMSIGRPSARAKGAKPP